ncbi:hypothetical protein J4434_06310 [Candidatus Woesearchaeota archaeon]|nr:hypothetical protein [Candidatus Woesearchaeota archaeon]
MILNYAKPQKEPRDILNDIVQLRNAFEKIEQEWEFFLEKAQLSMSISELYQFTNKKEELFELIINALDNFNTAKCTEDLNKAIYLSSQIQKKMSEA